MSATNSHNNLLGFDYGTKRIGIALGNLLTNTARGLTTISNPDWSQIDGLVEEWAPAALVVGLPLNMDGSEQPLTKAAEKFSRQLQQRYQLPTHCMDERLSSVEARQALQAQRAGGRKKRIRPEEKDSEAARIILQDWLALQ